MCIKWLILIPAPYRYVHESRKLKDNFQIIKNQAYWNNSDHQSKHASLTILIKSIRITILIISRSSNLNMLSVGYVLKAVSDFDKLVGDTYVQVPRLCSMFIKFCPYLCDVIGWRSLCDAFWRNHYTWTKLVVETYTQPKFDFGPNLRMFIGVAAIQWQFLCGGID